mgnify:CR=1 FL=1
MYLRILKKDIRQKKTMNIILLVFVILASMFITSSVGNLVSITSSLDVYLNEAGIKDYQIISWDEEEQKKEISKLQGKFKGVVLKSGLDHIIDDTTIKLEKAGETIKGFFEGLDKDE